MASATKNNLQEYDPRHRLTGAVVLILLAIVLLPMLLGKKTEPLPAASDVSEPVVMEVTKDDKKVFVSRISSVQEKPANKSNKNIEDDEAVPSSLIAPVAPARPAQSKAKTDPKPKPAKTVAKKPAPKSTATKKTTTKPRSTAKSSTKNSVPAAGSWILQVGVFSQASNANKKVAELKKKGFSAKSGRVKTSKGTASKVWIGPFKDRKSAEKMQDRLQHKTRQRGIVVKTKS